MYDQTTKIWSGIKEPMDMNMDTDISVGKLMIERLLENPDKIGQICYYNGKEYTNQEIAVSALSIATHLKKLGFKQGEVVGFVGSNTEYVASLVIAALLNGLAINPLYLNSGKDSITYIFSVTKPSIVFCDGSVFHRVQSALKEIGSQAPIYTIIEHILGVPDITDFLGRSSQMDTTEFEPLKDGGNQIAFIACSSGTTGLPKGVCISHKSLIVPKSKPLLYEDIVLCYSSLFWSSGILILTFGTLNGIIRLISRNDFSVEEFFDIVEKYKPSIVFSSPAQLTLCLASSEIETSDLSSIKSYVVAGSPLLPSIISKVKKFFTNSVLLLAYGMTEIPRFGISDGIATENGSVGKLVKNVEMKIVNDDNKSLGPNETGEILVRSNLPFCGYFGNPEATAAAHDKDGWIYTGDIGYVDDDGNVFILDRKKDILKCNNFQFYPTEIEAVIMEIPDVVEVCVCGIPDEISSYLPAAMVVTRAGSNINEYDISKYVADKMDDFKQLRGGVFFVKEIPKTPSGKNLRRKVVELCETLITNKN